MRKIHQSPGSRSKTLTLTTLAVSKEKSSRLQKLTNCNLQTPKAWTKRKRFFYYI